MHNYSDYFPHRYADDALDCAPLIVAGMAALPDAPVLASDTGTLTRSMLGGRVAVMQAWLAGQSLKKGDRVAVMLESGMDHIVLIYALMVSGLVWIPVNTRIRGQGLAYLLDHSAPHLLISAPAFDEVLAELEGLAVPRAAMPVESTTPIAAVPALPTLPEGGIRPDETLALIYTSGTTGAPKGVVFTHRMMRIASEAALRVSDGQADDRFFLWEPMHHIGGAQTLLLPFLEKLDLYLVPRFSASQFWDQVTRSKATQLHYLGGILDILMRLPEDAQPASHSLRVAWGGGLSGVSWEATRERLKVALHECYGMTECSSFATRNATGKPGSIGKVLPWLDLELLDESGQAVRDGEIGEIVLTSKVDGAFMPGYLRNEAATAQMLRDGKLYTGDSAKRDADGDLYFVGRRTDSMRVRGEMVSAWEIERVFAQHPDISACAAVGRASTVGEQDILLFVQFKAEQLDRYANERSADDAWPALRQWGQSRLANFQLPRYYRQIDQFELTPSERIKKHLLPVDLDHAWDGAARR